MLSLRKEFHSDLASLVLNEIQYQKSTYYYFLGKVEKWDGIEDAAPVTDQENSLEEDTQIRTNALYFKKISPNEVTLVCQRYDWSIGRIFSPWDHTIDMTGLEYYVQTDDFNVYKCLDNNAGAASTVKPTGTNFVPIRTADGYLWKFMYKIPNFKRKQFNSFQNFPVQRALTDSFYNRGSIEQVSVTNRGNGYIDAALTTILVTGGTTTGSGATVTFTLGVGGNVTGVNVTNGGSAYTHGAEVRLSSLSGSGAVLQPTIVAGVITGVTIVTAGIGYVTTDIMTVNVGGAAFVPAMSRSNGSLMSIYTRNPGHGYLTSPTVQLHSTTADGTGMYPGNAAAVLIPVLVGGSIARIAIMDPGVDYPVDTDTQIIVSGDGTGASFTPVVDNGQVVDVITESSGTGYTQVKLTVQGAGSGATIIATITASDFISEQSIVEQTAVEGAIHSVKITAGGEGYTSAATMTIVGDGLGATGSVVVTDGTIHNVIMTNFGSGYSWVEIIFNDPGRYDPLNTRPVATAYATLPPRGGHGKDAVTELNGNTLAISSSLRNEPLLEGLNQDFRQYGLLRNPTNIQTGVFFRDQSSLNVFECEFQSTAGLIIDENLQIDQTKFKVIYVNGQNVVLQRTSPLFKSPLGQMFAVDDGLRTYLCTRILKQPALNNHSGQLLYCSNENPFVFTENQGLLVKTYLKM